MLPLNQQVTSLALSKRLKELGVNQESLFYYQGTPIEIGAGMGYVLHYGKQLHWQGVVFVSAFTVAELGEMLPWSIEVRKEKFFLSFGGKENPRNMEYYPEFEISYSDGEDCVYLERAPTEADARAKMLIYLLENKLITL